MLRALLIVTLFGVMTPTVALAEGWSYTGGDGKTVSLDHVPARIVADSGAAAALISFGIRPVGIYGNNPPEQEKQLEGVDISGIAIVGQTWGEIDLEKVAALKPDLIVADYWPLDNAYQGFEEAVSDSTKQVLTLAPITGPMQGPSAVKLIEDYAALAESLGADPDAPAIADAKARFERSREAFKTAVASKPNLTVLPVWAGADALYVAATAGSSELSDFASWGLQLISPELADDRGYWETLSWEIADKYQPDLVIVDNRSSSTIETAMAQPMWTSIKAAAAGQVADWPAFWLRTYGTYAAELDKLTAAINAADENLTQ
jgi:iron complex transport system substrate-binding protein